MSTLWFESALLPQGWQSRVRVTVHDGRIADVMAGAPAQGADERHAIGLPGLPNVHSHAFQRALAGLTERRGPGADSFWTWRELMYRFVARMTPEDLEAITAYAFAEMLEGGFTSVAEFHYVHHQADGTPYVSRGELCERVAAAAHSAGIGLTLLPVLYAQGGFGGVPPSPRQLRFVNDLDGYERILAAARRAVQGLPGAVIGVAPHSLRAVTPQELAGVLALTGSGPVHMHVAEQAQEVLDCLAWSGQRPVEWLLANEHLDARWCLVHATQTTSKELRALAATGAAVGLCPITESSLGDGIFLAEAWLPAGGSTGIGSDSNVLIDAAAELATLEYSQRLAARARNVLAAASGHSTGRSLFDAALAGGAQACGAGPAGLAPGAWCDLVSLSPAHPSLMERAGDELLDSWVFAAGRSAVDCVWSRGTKVVAQGRHVRREPLLARYRDSLRGLLS
jgi:formiminoglutamate deiminase